MDLLAQLEEAYLEAKAAYEKGFRDHGVCPRCKNTGYIETGNNDLPCGCPFGDTAVFNTVYGQKTGAELKGR